MVVVVGLLYMFRKQEPESTRNSGRYARPPDNSKGVVLHEGGWRDQRLAFHGEATCLILWARQIHVILWARLWRPRLGKEGDKFCGTVLPPRLR